MLRHVAADPLRGLVHCDVHADEFDLGAILLVSRLKAGKQGFTVLAPGGPELEQHGLFPQPLTEIHGLAVEIVDRNDGSLASQLDAGFALRQERRCGTGRQENSGEEVATDQETFPI